MQVLRDIKPFTFMQIKLEHVLNGAGNESRTRDLNLGKVALYQLSYARVMTRL